MDAVRNEAIQDAVTNPVKVKTQLPQGPGYSPTTQYVGSKATVVVNQDGKVVTAWGTSSSETR
jgi:hypothetical protein